MATYQETLDAWNKAQQDLETAKAKIPKVGLYTGADAADVYGAAETARQNFYAADKALINLKNIGASELLSAGAKDYGLSNEQGTADYLASGLSPQDFLAGKTKPTPTAFETALKGKVAGGQTMEQAQQTTTPEGTVRTPITPTVPTDVSAATVNNAGQEDVITLSNGQTAVRDLAKEKIALVEYGKTYGKMPQTNADWQKLHDIAYAGDKKAVIPAGFEKIAHPDLVGQYDNIRRVGNVGEPGSYLMGKKKVVDEAKIIEEKAQVDELQKAKDVLAKYGVDTPDSNQSPATTFTETYKKLFTDLGLDTVKQSIKDGTTAIQKLKDEMNDKIIDVNDNPWLSEALRTKKINSIQNSYEGKLSNLTEKLQLDQSLLQSGQQEAQFVAGTGVTRAHNQQVLDQQLQLKLMDIAETQATTKIKTQMDLLKEGWNYVSTPLIRKQLEDTGQYEFTTLDGRTYARPLKVVSGGGGGGGGGGVKNETQAIKDMTAQLSTVTGDAGYVSPDDYLKARKAWIDNGYNPTTFDTKMAGFRNPNNPDYITVKQPKPEETNIEKLQKNKDAGITREAAKDAGFSDEEINQVYGEEPKKWWQFWK